VAAAVAAASVLGTGSQEELCARLLADPALPMSKIIRIRMLSVGPREL
jgi:hypothetical protein